MQKTPPKLLLKGYFVPWAGIEPARPKALVFETNASTSSATKAFVEAHSLLNGMQI